MANRLIFPTEYGAKFTAGQIKATTQGDTQDYVFHCFMANGEALDLSGHTVTLYFGAYQAVGAVAVDATVTNKITWTPDADDVSTAGSFALLVKAVDTDGTIRVSDAVTWVVAADATYAGGGTPGGALEGVTAAEKTWIGDALVSVPDAADLIPDAPSDGSQYGRQNGSWAAISAVSDVGDLTTAGLTAANMLRVASGGGGLEERTPAQVLADIGAEAAGAAAVAQAAAVQRANHTGTQLLSTISDVTATGSSLATAASVDAARAAIGLSAVVMPPRVLNHHTATWAAANVVGSFSASNYLNFTTLITTGATANSSGSWRINDNSLSLNYTNGSVNWSRKVNISLFLRRGTANAQGIAYWTVGKIPSAAYGLVASGDYIGIKIENQTVTGLVYCVSGTVTTIPVSKSIASTGTPIYITSNNGNIEWYADGVAIGSTASGPTANTFGTIFAEIQNGATAANYTMSIISSSEGF